MMAQLLDLKGDEAKVSTMMEFVPFKMNIIIKGIKITMMEIPRAVPSTVPKVETPRQANTMTTPNANHNNQAQSSMPNGERRGILKNTRPQDNAATSNVDDSAPGTSTQRADKDDILNISDIIAY